MKGLRGTASRLRKAAPVKMARCYHGARGLSIGADLKALFRPLLGDGRATPHPCPSLDGLWGGREHAEPSQDRLRPIALILTSLSAIGGRDRQEIHGLQACP